MRSNASRKILENLALATFGLIIAVVVIELVPRILPTRLLPKPVRYALDEMDSRLHSMDPYLPDPKLWYVIRPGIDMIIRHPEADFRMKTNLNFPTAGFRGGTLGGTAWGVAVGDSFTFGPGVEHQETWVAQLSEISRREFVNLGVPGWGPGQYTLTLEEYGLPLKPKIVLYCLFSNDIANVARFENDEGHFNQFSLRHYMRLHSVTYNLFRRVRRSRSQNDTEEYGPGLNFSKTDLRKRLAAERNRFAAGWPLTEQQIETAYHQSEASQAHFVLLYFPSKEEVYWDLIKDKQRSLAEFDDAIDLLRRSALALCRTRHFTCLDLTPVLKNRASRGEKLYFSIDTHWTKAGNRAVAEEIYQELRRKELL